MRLRSDTFLSKEDVKQAYIVASTMSNFEQMMDILYKEIDERIVYNKEVEREADVKKHFAQTKRERTLERNKARKHNEAIEARRAAGEYVDINDEWWLSPPPHAISYRGITVCGWCLLRKEEGKPKEGCKFHYWDRKDIK